MKNYSLHNHYKPMLSLLMICCLLMGCATSFQHRQLLLARSASAFSRVSDGHHQYCDFQTYLLGYNKEGLTKYYSSRWQTRYQELAEFYKKHGHSRVGKEDGSLWQWIRTQRHKRNEKLTQYTPLTDEQIRLLDEIDFPWSYNDSIWHTRYQELAEFYEKHGHYGVAPNKRLHSWLKVQRQKRKGTGDSALTDEQIQLLDGINFPWDPLRTKWDLKYQELAEFYKEHGHLKVEDGSSLFWWVVTQRRRRKGLNGRSPLSDEEIQLLDEIDFDWDPTKDWNKTKG